MTSLSRPGPRASPEGIRPGTGGHAASRGEAAPALFKLLTDSALYRSAFAACRFPMAIVDASSTGRPLVHVNPAFERCFGFAESELRGRPFAAALFRGDEESAERLFADPSGHALLQTRGKDGKTIEVEISAGPVRDSGGRHTHWVVAFASWGEPGLK